MQADRSTSRAWSAARSLCDALVDATLMAPRLVATSKQDQAACAPAATALSQTPVQALTEAILSAMVPPVTEPPSPPTSAAVGYAAISSAASTNIAWRERHAAEVLWGLPPTVGGVVVRMHASVRLLTDALASFMKEDPPAPRQGSESSALAIDAVSSITAEDTGNVLASGLAAAQAATQLADVAVATCVCSPSAVAKDSAAVIGSSEVAMVCEQLQELLGSICRLLDGMKSKLAAVHLMRDERWVLNQLRLVRLSRCVPTA